VQVAGLRLMDGEQVALSTRPHWKFILAGCCIAAVTVPLWLLAVVKTNVWFGSWSRWPNLVVGVIAVVVLIRYTARPVVQWAFTRYTVTTMRVMSRSGVFTRHAADIPLDHVSNVNYNQSFTDRLMRCGSITLDSSGGDGFELDNVPDVEDITRLIQQLRRLEHPPTDR